MIDFDHIINNGVTITSSGTTGIPKKIFRNPTNLKYSVEVAIDAQEISKSSKILTVTRMTHAGGLLAQTLPAHVINAEYEIIEFNPFSFFKQFQKFTHTFLPPQHMQALIKTKDFKTVDLKNKWILGGSDPVSWELIEAFVKKGAIVQPNWGMSEIGPITINAKIDSMDKLYFYKNKFHQGTILGDTYYCDFKVENDILFVKGPTCYIDGWLNTNDKVKVLDDSMFFLGRNSTN